MKLDFTYQYTATIIPPRCRKARQVWKQRTQTLTFREITSAEAPVAIIERHPGGVADDGGMSEVVNEFRWYGNRLWVKNSFQRGCGMEYENQTADQFRDDPYPHTLAMPSYDSRRYQSRKDRELGFRKWAKSILFIDGIRYEHTEEPRYYIRTFGLGYNHGGTALFAGNRETGKHTYRIDQFEEAAAEATRTALERGDDKSLPFTEGATRYEIMIPQALRSRPHGWKRQAKQLAELPSRRIVEELVGA